MSRFAEQAAHARAEFARSLATAVLAAQAQQAAFPQDPAAGSHPGSAMPGMPGGPMGAAGVGGINPLLMGGSVGQRIVMLAQGEVGVREEPHGSNDGPRIREYRTATAGAEHTPGPWCAYFVSWLAREAGAPIGENGQGTGWVPTIEAWGRQAGRFLAPSTQPAPGDIIIFDRNGNGTSDHTGIVEYVGTDGTIHTIEGNVSSQDVARRSYAPSERQVVGYVRAG